MYCSHSWCIISWISAILPRLHLVSILFYDCCSIFFFLCPCVYLLQAWAFVVQYILNMLFFSGI
uniref:Uncharacterized protein n=1 Tax=Arundo donax TaxID=35708 RepID=A0A0A9CKW4_ARUDO